MLRVRRCGLFFGCVRGWEAEGENTGEDDDLN